jgi:hypothetical protein
VVAIAIPDVAKEEMLRLVIGQSVIVSDWPEAILGRLGRLIDVKLGQLVIWMPTLLLVAQLVRVGMLKDVIARPFNDREPAASADRFREASTPLSIILSSPQVVMVDRLRLVNDEVAILKMLATLTRSGKFRVVAWVTFPRTMVSLTVVRFGQLISNTVPWLKLSTSILIRLVPSYSRVVSDVVWKIELNNTPFETAVAFSISVSTFGVMPLAICIPAVTVILLDVSWAVTIVNVSVEMLLIRPTVELLRRGWVF